MSGDGMTRKIPERRCIGCYESYPKSELLRIVRTPEGEITLDFTGKKNGRGAYLCRKAECFRIARKKDRLKAALNTEIPEGVLDKVEEEIARFEEEK